MKISSEQEVAASVPGGFCMVSANAGTGKTETCAEYFIRKYLQEEKRAFPDSPAKGRDQIELLKQFIVLTFTQRAAYELDHRIKSKLEEAGREAPQIKICRTIDSLLQKWFYHPLFLTRWLRANPVWLHILRERLTVLGKNSTLESFKHQAEQRFPTNPEFLEIALIQKWNMLLPPSRQNILYDIMLEPYSGITPMLGEEDLLTTLDAALNNANLKEDNKYGLLSKFWYETESRRKGEQFKYRSLERKNDTTLTGEETELLKRYHHRELLRSEFEAAYELARSYGYIALDNQAALGNSNILYHLSNNTILTSIETFHNLSVKYEMLKRAICALDFTDFLYYAQQVFKANPELLEKDKDYPRLGFRAHWVIIDEAQDLSLYNYHLLNHLCGKEASFGTLVVGDFKQSIYQWKGAQPQEFLRYATHLKKNCPRNLFYLTCSFRSSSKIVALGNEIATTLPNYKSQVQPSSVSFELPGNVVVLSPAEDLEQEANLVLGMYKGLRAQYGPDHSIFILWRKNGWKHPISTKLPNDQNLRYLSVHQAKGLEADIVFILSCSSSVFPDPLADADQEVNLFYVACTRARSQLYLSATLKIEHDKKIVATGPNPYFLELPALKRAALQSGWDIGQLTYGKTFHAKLIAEQNQVSRRRLTQLQQECQIKNIPIQRIPVAQDYEAASTAPIVTGTKASLPPAQPFLVDRKIRPDMSKIFRIAQEAFKTGKLPSELTKAEFDLGYRAGWWEKSGGRWVFTQRFKEIS